MKMIIPSQRRLVRRILQILCHNMLCRVNNNNINNNKVQSNYSALSQKLTPINIPLSMQHSPLYYAFILLPFHHFISPFIIPFVSSFVKFLRCASFVQLFSCICNYISHKTCFLHYWLQNISALFDTFSPKYEAKLSLLIPLFVTLNLQTPNFNQAIPFISFLLRHSI